MLYILSTDERVRKEGNMQLTKYDGSDMVTTPRAVKLRLADVFRRPDQTATAFIAGELKQLTEADLNDFRAWFAEAGYPCA